MDVEDDDWRVLPMEIVENFVKTTLNLARRGRAQSATHRCHQQRLPVCLAFSPANA